MSMTPQQLQGYLADAGLPAGYVTPVSGGTMPAFRLVQGNRSWFIKMLPSEDMAAAEADGLAALTGPGMDSGVASAMVVPKVEHQYPVPGGALLVLQWLELVPPGDSDEAAFAEALAALHGRSADEFGWHRDNWIGPARQYNTPKRHWRTFYRDLRLAPQLEWARQAGLPETVAEDVEWVMLHIDAWLDDSPVPALVHGDLWHGNRAVAGGRPALFDPAVYHGDPLVDLAMLCLFGRPGASFWPAYTALRAVDRARFRRLKPLYDLYHWLNHFTLFGESYLMAVRRCCATLRQELRG